MRSTATCNDIIIIFQILNVSLAIAVRRPDGCPYLDNCREHVNVVVLLLHAFNKYELRISNRLLNANRLHMDIGGGRLRVCIEIRILQILLSVCHLIPHANHSKRRAHSHI